MTEKAKGTTNPAAMSALISGDLENFKVASRPGGIEAQEKAGQATLVGSTDMPLEMRPSREAFEAAGFRFGAPVDSVFLSAELPPGWTRRAADHAMHSLILDDRGRERVSVFYKAAFYDRRADARLLRRFVVERLYPDERPGLTEDQVVVVVKDCSAGTVIYEQPPSARFSSSMAPEDAARRWLTDACPRHEDPLAYWDEP